MIFDHLVHPAPARRRRRRTPSASTSAARRPSRAIRTRSATCWPRRRARARSWRGSSGAIRSCSIRAARKRCSCTSRACPTKWFPACRRRSAPRPTPAFRSPIPAAATRSPSCAGTRTKAARRPRIDWDALATLDGTIVSYAGRSSCRRCCESLIEHGRIAGRAGRDHPARHAVVAADDHRHARRARANSCRKQPVGARPADRRQGGQLPRAPALVRFAAAVRRAARW